MKQSSILENVYARIDILDLNKDNESFIKIASIYMIGEASKYVKTSSDFSIKNRKLVAALGLETVKALSNKNDTIKGGDEWDELDDMDLEELLNTDDIQIKTNNAPVSEKKSSIEGDHFTDYVLYTTDKAFDIREKVAIITKIEPYKQYLWEVNQSKSIDGDSISLMSHWHTSLRNIEGYPIDGYPQVHIGETMDKSLENHKYSIITCISIDAIVNDKLKLQFLARSDSESYELIYGNLINKFYPMITLPIFNQYLADETLIQTKFESCVFDLKSTIARYQKRMKLISDLTGQKKVSIDSSDLLSVTTTGMVLTFTSGHTKSIVDTINIFQSINLNKIDKIGHVDLYCFDDNMRPIRSRKLQLRDQFQSNGNNDSFQNYGIQFKKLLIHSRAIIFNLLPQSQFNSIKISIDRFGSIKIYTQPNQTHSFSKAAFIQIIAKIIDPIISEINTIENAFTIHERFPLLNDPVRFRYQVPSSSSKLSFIFAISYSKLLDLCIEKLLAAGFIKPSTSEYFKRNNLWTSFSICYGISTFNTEQRQAGIDIRNVAGIASIVLSNLDVEETNLYVDIIGRIIKKFKSTLEMPSSNKTQLNLVDPVLFRLKMTSDGYSRICQRKFQPVVANANDKKAVEYYNFTFERPEYYSCPSKDAPVLGFIQGKHEKGYCLPCCRKTSQSNAEELKSTCIAKENTQTHSSSTYKIDYPIIEIPNSKIMNRRMLLPRYVSQLLGIQNIVANGTILASHQGIRDGMDPNTKSYLQTAMIVAAIETGHGHPLYNSSREFILDVIGMIKQPLMQATIMRNKLIADRFTTPQSLIHSIEDYFIRNHILGNNSNLSAIEWNDLIIYLANCMGLNVLLLADERIKSKGIQMINLHDIDVAKSVLILLRRTNIEWSSQNHNTRALYLPITTNSFKVLKISSFIVQKIDVSKGLSKIKRVTSGVVVKILSKQLNINTLQQFVNSNKAYKILEDKSDQKIAIIGIGKNKMITTISTLSTTIQVQNIEIVPTCSFKDLITFITDYNTYFLNDTPELPQLLGSYKLYIQLALKTTHRYEFVKTEAFLLKLHKFIIYDSMVIGIIVNLVDVIRVVSTELMFIKPTSIQSIKKELINFQSELKSIQSRINLKSIITFAISTEILLDPLSSKDDIKGFDSAFITWLNNPLRPVIDQKKSCNDNMKSDFDVGIYTSEIYNSLVRDIITPWKEERSDSLDQFIVKELKKIGSIPIPQTKVDTLIDDIANTFEHYDPNIIRSVIVALFENINSICKNTKDAISNLMNDKSFVGFDLLNIHRFKKTEITSKVKNLLKDLTINTNKYPILNPECSIKDQKMKFYDKKSGKLIIHTELYQDLLNMIVSDLSNPFRREYIINMPLVESSFIDTQPHLGEIIYTQFIDI